MPKHLTDAQARDFREKGFVAPVRVLADDRLAYYQRHMAEFEAKYGRIDRDKLRTKAHLLLPWLAELVREPTILDTLEDVVGPDVMVWGCGFVVKEGGDPAFVSWHQDAFYWRWEPHNQITAWIALTPAPVEAGCMRMYPMPVEREGAIIHHDERPDRLNLLMHGQTIAEAIDEAKAVDAPLKPGEMSIHHEYTPHASHPNRTPNRRVGFSIQYITPDMRETWGPRSSASLVRGEDRYRNFDPEPVPQVDYDPAAVAVYDEQKRLYMTLKKTGQAA